MIKKLRIRLVVAAMVSLLIVLSAIVGVAGVLNYRSILTEADLKLALLAENNGKFPEDIQKVPFELPRETAFESRYFSVLLNEDGTAVAVNTGKIAAVDTEQAAAYGEQVVQSGRQQGFVDDYRYLVVAQESGTYLVFLDCSRDLRSFRSFVLTSIGASAAGSVAVLILLVLLSERIVRPVSETYEKQKRFITDAGHELKTPLTIINADAEVLEMDFGESEWLNDIQSQTKRLAELTNNLIFLARMEETQPKLEQLDFPLSDLASETVDTFQALAKTSGRTLESSIQPMIAMHGDEKAIQRLITIFLDNAMKYSDEGGRITVTLEKQRSQIRLSVFNTADSVPRESLDNLFDRFYRADPSRNSKAGGYGLGLSIAAAIVRAHRGKITAATQDEKSLLITVTFPI